MRRIYSCADEILIWLGQSDTHTSIALELIRKIAYASCRRHYGEGPTDQWLSQLAQEPNLFDVAGAVSFSEMPDSSNIVWLSFSAFYERPWFSRVWVIQGNQSSKRAVVLCGSQENRMGVCCARGKVDQ